MTENLWILQSLELNPDLSRHAKAFHLHKSTNCFVCLFKEVGIALSIIYSLKCSNPCKLEGGSPGKGWSLESVGGWSEGGVLCAMDRLRTWARESGVMLQAQ